MCVYLTIVDPGPPSAWTGWEACQELKLPSTEPRQPSPQADGHHCGLKQRGLHTSPKVLAGKAGASTVLLPVGAHRVLFDSLGTKQKKGCHYKNTTIVKTGASSRGLGHPLCYSEEKVFKIQTACLLKFKGKATLALLQGQSRTEGEVPG